MHIIVQFVTDRYDVRVNDDKPSNNEVELNKSTLTSISNNGTFNDMINHDDDDPNIMEMHLHNSEATKNVHEYPVFVVSPITHLIWLYLLEPFRNIIDLNFKRRNNWTDDDQVLRFNDTWYLTCHNILDWHEFALLQNKSFLHKGIIVQDKNGIKSLITDIEYDLPHHIKSAKKRSDFRKHKQLNFWKGKAILKYKLLREYDDFFVLGNKIREHILQPDHALIVIKQTELLKPIHNKNGEEIVINVPLQHPHVKDGKEFFFGILGMDEYHHTAFSGKRDWESHGIYWWIGNMCPEVQFTTPMTMVMGQTPSAVPIQMTGKIIYSQWNNLMHHGMLLWTGQALKRRYAMVSHQIADLKERVFCLRKRGHVKQTRCDSLLWLGYYHGCKWPTGCDDLMQLGIIMPGPYLLKLWKFLNKDCVPGLWERFPPAYGQAISLTTCTSDFYNEVPLASGLKSTVELNHTTVIGCLARAFKIEWFDVHKKHNCNASLTRKVLSAYLKKYVHHINGVSSILMRPNTKMNVFNQMNQAWQKFIEILIAFPVCVAWYGNVPLLCSLIRVIGLLFCVRSENDRNKAKRILIPILDAS